MNVIEELWWRGMIHEIIPGTDAYLAENKVAVYLGVDPYVGTPCTSETSPPS